MKFKKATAILSAAAIVATTMVPIMITHAAETTLTVGTDKQYQTIRAAVAKAKEINPQGEDSRVTIEVDPGNYEEQVMLEDINYVTLQQTPGTTGKVNLYWHYCTGYCAGDCGLDGRYDPKINWSDPRTWSGYHEGDEQFTAYRLGQQLEKGTKISYYDTDGVAHKDVVLQKDHLGDFTDQAALFINNKSTNITVKDFNIVNSIPVMVTEGEKRVGVAPQEDRNADHATQYVLPRRDNLAVCSEDTPMEETARVKEALAIRDDVQKVKALEALTDLTAGESAYLARSDKYNERGHAIAVNGDKLTFENIRVRGNQDSVWVGSGRMYFKNCDLIGGTDYIYGDASVVFDSCKLGAEGMSNKDYGATITAANHDAKNPYGYLFYNCELYNVLSNITNSAYGRPWRQDAQITFYNTKLDDTAVTGASPAGIISAGWNDMSGNEAAKARFYEYGTYNASGKAVDLSKRLQNENGFGSVLNNWQILEFNPRNYFNNDFWAAKGEWDPMNFAAEYLTEVDTAIANADINIPSGEETTVDLPQAPEGIEFKWESASSNAIVSADGTKLQVVRPAAGENPIKTTVTLYAMNKATGFGDKKDISVTINPTTDTTNVFNIPVTIEQSAKDENTYTVTLTKNDALIKEQVIKVAAGETTAAATIDNIPASTDGIDYDLKVVSESNDFTVVAPEDGKTTVKGITGQNVELNITAQKLVDASVDLGILYSSTEGNKVYDLIALAKEKGADVSSGDEITVSYVLDVTQKSTGSGYIDLLAGEPSSSVKLSGEPSRFLLGKLGHWNQLDFVDSAQAYGGSSNGPDQWLNACGKFDTKTLSNVAVNIDYKNQTIKATGSGTNSESSYSFATFPENYAKGQLKMAIYPGSEAFNIKSVKLTYKKIVTGDEPEATPLPSGQGSYIFPADRDHVVNGNQCNADDTFTFVEGADARLIELLKDQTDSTLVDAAYTGHYLNYIGGTNANGTHPQITLDAPAGLYTVYLIGYNNEKSVQAKVDGKTYTAEAGVPFAAKTKNPSYVLKSYKIDVEVNENNDTIMFDSTESWLPDAYIFVVDARQADLPTPTPEATATAAATSTPEATETSTPGVVVGGDTYTVNADTPVAAGSVYTDNEHIRVAGEFATTVNPAGENDAVVEFGGKTFTHSMNVRVDSKDPDKGNYTEKAGSTPLHIDAKTNGTFTIYYRRQAPAGYTAADGKDIKLSHKNGTAYEVAAAGTYEDFGFATAEQNYVYWKQTWQLKAGESYLLWARGTTGTLYSYEFVPDGGTETTTVPSTEKPTATATVNPTEIATEVVTNAPTNTPDVTKRIVSAFKNNGNTQVKLANITDGVVIAVTYENGVLKTMKTAPVTGSDITIEGIEADKVFVWDSLEKMHPVCSGATATVPTTDAPATDAPATQAPTIQPGEAITVDFTAMSEVPVYSAEAGQGFVAKSDSIMPDGFQRVVSTADQISVSAEGAKITESNGSYLHAKASDNKMDGDDYNNGGLIYRIDTGAPGAYHLEVEITGTSSDTRVAPTGMNSGNLTGKSNWDNCGMTPRTVSAQWNDNVWSYDFGTGENFVEIEIEPTTLATAAKPQTVGVKKITVTPLAKNAAGDKPTIHILGDSTQKSYSFNETISSWGQTLKNYFDLDKVNVVNYSMGGRAMKSNYCEGRFDEILIRGHEGDYVFLHSAHNDETVSTNRFSRGAGSVANDLAANNENYNKWLNMYVEAIKARGMIPVLVTAMPRINSVSGKYNAGFNPDSPGNMRAKAKADSNVGLAELYEGAKAYIDSLDGKEVGYIYNSIEAGETPANNSANGAKGDGTHYREAAAKQFCRIILQSIYDQSKASSDEYTDKDIMQGLVSYMQEDVVNAAQSGNWSAVFPEMASDVSAVGVIPGAEKQSVDNFYYRTSIEKALQLGLLHKDSNNLFKPTQTITVGEYARGIEKAFGLEENSLTSYSKTYAELQAEGASVSAYDAGVVSMSEEVTAAESGEAGEGDTVITVEQPVGGVVTVYNESAYKTATTDITASVDANQVLEDNEYYTFTAPATVVKKNDKNGSFAANAAITADAIETRNDGEKQPIYTAKADGTLTMYLMFVDHKVITCENVTDGTKATKYINNTTIAGTTKANKYEAVTFDVKAGNEYQIYTNGGTGRLFGIMYASNNYPQSTSQLNANAGDTIRVIAVPNENYVNGSILVNGNEISTSKECTFVLEGDTTVTATFTSEPALVEITAVASDAALTREVMGAILYDAYQLADKTIMAQYMDQNGGVPTPDDPNYDPNIQYEGSPYIPITGWGALTDKGELSESLYAKVKAAYNAGLIRPETGIARGSIALGTELEPKAEVTRAKAAKSLVFAFILTQPLSNESQMIPAGINHASETAEIAVPNPEAPSVVLQ